MYVCMCALGTNRENVLVLLLLAHGGAPARMSMNCESFLEKPSGDAVDHFLVHASTCGDCHKLVNSFVPSLVSHQRHTHLYISEL